MGSGSSAGYPPSSGTVKSLGGSVLLLRPETKRMLLPSGVSGAIVRRVIGEAPQFTARGRDDEDVVVAVVVGGVGDPFAIGGEVGVAFGSDAGGEALRVATLAADGPDIARIAECDLVAADGGVPDQQRLGSLGAAERGKENGTKRQCNMAIHSSPAASIHP
jgi:hypothetical protein